MSIILNFINYFWKLGFSETRSDIYVKKYRDSYQIEIDMANEIMNYGEKIRVSDESLVTFSQKNFVILECIDRFLENGYQPAGIHVKKHDSHDITVDDLAGKNLIAVKCTIWEGDYDKEVNSLKTNPDRIDLFFKEFQKIPIFFIYTSRMKAGLIDHKYTVFSRENDLTPTAPFNVGLLDDISDPYSPTFLSQDNIPIPKNGNMVADLGDFIIDKTTLIGYKGNKVDIIIPFGIKKLISGAFWNCTQINHIAVPETVISLGGDTFLDCTGLEELIIPKNCKIIGDNPFANCPKLNLINKSPFFTFENGALFNKEKTRLIYYSINAGESAFRIPYGVVSIGKHAFYNCKTLEKIIIPSSVKIIENNPFSNCPLLNLENNSPNFKIIDGALYDRTMTTLFYYNLSRKSTSLSIPEGVKIIGRHSFYHSPYLKTLTIPSSVEIIGYNPFANCPSLSQINNHSPNYLFERGTLYNKTKTDLIFHNIPDRSGTFVVPETITKIGRNAFYGCIHLEEIQMPEGVETIERSAFADCTNLKRINIPKSVTSIGEWAFYNCHNMREIDIADYTSTESHTFYKCPAKINRMNIVT